MIGRRRRDSGQAFPIYVVMVAGLLFLAVAFFAVGKAAALRNGAQGAADAAALAAARQVREDLESQFLAALPERLLPVFLAGHGVSPGMPCAEAQRLATANKADAIDCQVRPGGSRDMVTVKTESRKTVDSPVIPGSNKTTARQHATAVIQFRCSWHSADFNDDSVEDIYFFSCDKGGMVEIRPSSPPPWSEVSKILFDVHLIDD
ncbi:pilus assembly protein TadG-related protein [Streptomyces sp. NPDC048496]|uniref:pilus assembly protein TadG-related protein n=1 Tax=Streptomyces sp. NPDC048496 TaxID=3365558 RepID=UPI00371EBF19